MIKINNQVVEAHDGIGRTYVRPYLRLLKPRLSFFVVVSAAFGYLFPGYPDFPDFSLLKFLGFLFSAFLISGSGGGINQILERKTDAQMYRTRKRPLPMGEISKTKAWTFSLIVGIFGMGLMGTLSRWEAVGLASFSWILYAFVYTPIKRRGSLAVLIGAIPGALPPLIGWWASGYSLNICVYLLFFIQFVWQFPHFWAIAWRMNADYKRVNFFLLPFQQGYLCALTIFVWNLLLIPIGLLPSFLGYVSWKAGWGILLLGIFFLFFAFRLLKQQNESASSALMRASFLYLPVVQALILFGKI
ncbi:MAG: heme o synthase [Cytophagales bacterium]|nr:heme o synthase [Cytophagales bacterium]